MSDAVPVTNLQEYSVSELAFAIKRSIEDGFGRVRLRGEISGLSRPRSGHLYMDLKDTDAVLAGVCWKGVAGRLGVVPEEGMEVIVTGKITAYPKGSKYQIVIEAMEMAGEGALLKLLEDRKRKLGAEGLFDEDSKVEPPYLPEVIGVVTSPSGAVIRDILHRLADRFPRHVLLWPVRVQGEGAAEEVAAAIEGFNSLGAGDAIPRPDVLIVARGGGSVEDLWAFNEEIVVRAAAASDIPLISAIGHEPDFTLIDFASDLRAPTPTAAAEFAVPMRADLIAGVTTLGARLFSGTSRALDRRRGVVEGLARGLRGPREALELATQRLDHSSERLFRAFDAALAAGAQRLENTGRRLRPDVLRRGLDDGLGRLSDTSIRMTRGVHRALADNTSLFGNLASRLESVSHHGVLARGYAVVRGQDGAPVVSASSAVTGMGLDIELRDGHISTVVTDAVKPLVSKKPSAPKIQKAKSEPKPKPPGTNDPQGSLL
jgi:exodeoxyribonuclease VII large subunit